MNIVMNKMIHILSLLCLGILMTACAGPYSPFGALNSWPTKFTAVLDVDKNPIEKKFSFYPQKQNLHRVSDLQVVIEDNQVIPENFVLEIYYNNKDITQDFLKTASIKRHRNELHIIFENLSLGTKIDHEIYFKYQTNPTTKPFIAKYEDPKCNFDYVEENKVENELLNRIFKLSSSKGINPYLIMGLIAQESSFNNKAVSSAKAIGLTQVTAIAEKHILENYPKWPTYPNLNKQSILEIKAMIATDEVNPGNEWRLNKDKSILGAIDFIRYIESFWEQNKHQKLLEHSFGSNEIPLEIILASYNSGPFRVKRAIQNRGIDWINSNQLNEARKYVRKIKSYCHAFKSNLNQEKKYFSHLRQYRIDNERYTFNQKSRSPANRGSITKLELISKN